MNLDHCIEKPTNDGEWLPGQPMPWADAGAGLPQQSPLQQQWQGPPARNDVHTLSKPTASGILAEASKIVAGERNATHGAKEDSFAAIAGMWTAYLRQRRKPDGPIRPHDVAHMMVLMKQQRAEWGTPVKDHYLDGAAYSAIAGELARPLK